MQYRQLRTPSPSLWRTTLLILSFVCSPFLLNLWAQPAAAQELPTLRVATKEISPFVMKEGDRFTGFSIDLWEEMAERADVSYEYHEFFSVQDLIDAVSTGDAHLAIAAISITSNREEVIDFSIPIFSSGLQILVSDSSQSLLGPLLASIFSTELLAIIGIALLILVLMAHIIWLLERHHNPDFDPRYLQGIWDAFWWSSVTGTTTGYGDKIPRGLLGRLVTIIWMFTSVVLLSYFTAAITTSLTVQGLHDTINGPKDLSGHRVGTIEGTTSEEYLEKHKIKPFLFTHIDSAYQALEQNRIDAIVFDSPTMLHYSTNDGDGKVHLVGPVFRKEYYGIVLPNDAPQLERINNALLQLIEDGTYDQLYERWFSE